MTNADKIRSKSDHQLAEWLYFIGVCCECCKFMGECREDYENNALMCYEGVTKWLAESDEAKTESKDELLEYLARIHRALEMSRNDSCGKRYETLNGLMSAIREIQDAIIIYGDCADGGEESMTELKACPFCGSEDVTEVFHGDNPFNVLFYVQCNNCGGRSKDKRTREEARDAWNRRAADGTD